MSEGYAGQTALVTGASQGIGAQFATEFGRRGTNLVLAARNASALNELADSLRAQFGVGVHVEILDLADPSASASLHSRLTDLGMNVDVLINNAGLIHQGAIADTDHLIHPPRPPRLRRQSPQASAPSAGRPRARESSP